MSSAQMYVDLIVGSLKDEESQSTGFNHALVGTLSGSNVHIDAVSEPIPLDEFDFLVDDAKNAKPNYKNGDRLFIIPANDGNQLVVVGRLI